MLASTLAVGPLACNCSVLIDPTTLSAAVIDPGGHFDLIKATLERSGAHLVAILHTHVHIDHIGASAGLRAWSGAPARIHSADRFLDQTMSLQAALVGISMPERCDFEADLVDDDVIEVGKLRLTVLH